MKHLIFVVATSIVTAAAVQAEDRTYGSVYLSGLARDSWPHNPAGLTYTMVCHVNGPDGFLSVREGPGTDYAQARAFNRLAILEVDTRQRQGNWVRVVDAQRTHSADGVLQDSKSLPVQGWAHDGYLCDFID